MPKNLAEPLHPVIAAFTRQAAELTEILRSQPAPREPLVETMLQMQIAVGKGDRDGGRHAYRLAEEVDGQKYDRDLYLLFLRVWFDVAYLCGRAEDALTILRRAQSLLADETPAEIPAALLLREGLLQGLKGDKAAREESQKRVLAMLDPDSPRRWPVVGSRALLLCQQGRGRDVRDELAWLEARTREESRPAIVPILRFIDCVEAGRAREADAHLERVSRGEDMLKYRMSCYLPLWRVAVDLMLGRWSPGGGALPDETPPMGREIILAWAGSTFHLLAGRVREALSEARRTLRLDPDQGLHLGFQSYAMIRAELAAGNGEAARRLIGRRRSTGYLSYLDDFFFARVELLAGNAERAAAHFAAARSACRRYDAEARLDFELRMAAELSPGDLVRLASRAERLGGNPAPAARTVAARPRPRGVEAIVGPSPAIERLRSQIARLAALDVPVLVSGETGTGKELVSRALHEGGPRNSGPFVAVNCGAIGDSLLESELFGHERGAFTGAERSRRGLFEEAGDGTVLLDEIGEISPRLQVALLRVLETGEIRPVGSSRPRKISCRVLAATNADLGELVAAGKFREDLLYRLRRMLIEIPPLRERREDIEPLAELFLAEGRAEGQCATMSTGLVADLRGRRWPGNVRQLRNFIEQMRLMNSEKLFYDLRDIESVDAPAGLQSGARTPSAGDGPGPRRAADEVLARGRSGMRRLERLRELFRQHRKLTRREVAELIGICPATATRDLKGLLAEGFIEKVKPTPSPRSHYFRLSAPGPAGPETA